MSRGPAPRYSKLCWHPLLGDYNPRRLTIEAHVEFLLDTTSVFHQHQPSDVAHGAPDDWPTVAAPHKEGKK
jgi:hypothetical protein